jgi:uncharacterized protein (TIGR02996 family)
MSSTGKLPSLELPPLPPGIEQEYQRIRAYPDDDTPRLIYADWLDERGDPRGEFIRVQIALARLSGRNPFSYLPGTMVSAATSLWSSPAGEASPRYAELRRREFLLLSRHREEWLAPFRGWTSGEEFRRGFVESVKITARAFLAHAPRLFALTPLRHVQILDLDHGADSLAACPFLDRLEALTIHAQYCGPSLAAALARSPYLHHLRQLRLSRNRLGDEGLVHLCRRSWPSLEELDLSDNGLTGAAALHLQKSQAFPRLRCLQLRDNDLGPAGACHLADGPLLRQLQFLGLAGNRLGQSHFAGPLHSLVSILSVPHLDLADNGFTAESLRGWLFPPLDCPTVPVRYLDLSRNPLGDAGSITLASARHLEELRVLILCWCNIGDAGAQALARAFHLRHLHTLDLSNNPIGGEGFRAFVEPFTRRLPALRRLLRTSLTLPHHLNQELNLLFPPRLNL